MIDKLQAIKNKFDELVDSLNQPDVISDQKKYTLLSKEYKNLKPIVEAYEEYTTAKEREEEATEIIANEADAELVEMAKEELQEYKEVLAELEEKIKVLLIPKDPNDDKNAMLEIRAGTGGDEASIFVGDIFRAFVKYAETKRWKVEILDVHEGTSGGYKEIIFNIIGENAYGDFKFEAGVHRVQRVPKTETQGRVHTSAVSVVVMPEAEDFDVEIDMNEIRKDLYCSSGPGGQSVNTTYSAVRLTHIPTGIVAQCQDQKSQHRNFEQALKVLRSRIYDHEMKKVYESEAEQRRSMVSTGDRSAKVRTYNYPQGRVTDHRINFTLYALNEVMNGDFSKLTEALKVADNAEKLAENI